MWVWKVCCMSVCLLVFPNQFFLVYWRHDLVGPQYFLRKLTVAVCHKTPPTMLLLVTNPTWDNDGIMRRDASHDYMHLNNCSPNYCFYSPQNWITTFKKIYTAAFWTLSNFNIWVENRMRDVFYLTQTKYFKTWVQYWTITHWNTTRKKE